MDKEMAMEFLLQGLFLLFAVLWISGFVATS